MRDALADTVKWSADVFLLKRRNPSSCLTCRAVERSYIPGLISTVLLTTSGTAPRLTIHSDEAVYNESQENSPSPEEGCIGSHVV